MFCAYPAREAMREIILFTILRRIFHKLDLLLFVDIEYTMCA